MISEPTDQADSIAKPQIQKLRNKKLRTQNFIGTKTW